MKSAGSRIARTVLCGVVICATLAGYGGGVQASDEPVVEVAEEEWDEILGQSDGRYTKHGWNHYGPGHFDLDPESGVLTSHGGMGLLWYAVRQYADFVLELEFRCQDEHTNSGVFVRVPDVPTSDDYIYHSFEIQIDEAGRGIHGTGAVYDAEAAAANAAKPPGEWNRYRIAFVGERLSVDLNGSRVIDWMAEPRGKVDDFARRGYVGLQNHDDRSSVQFRDIRVRRVRDRPESGGATLCSTRAQM